MGDKDKSEDLFREFLSRRESGEDVNPEEYYQKYPELEADLRKLLDKLSDKKLENANVTSLTPEPLQIISDYKIIKEIGRGGMGTVYEAEQISLKRKVALKVLPSHLRFSKEAVLKFRREAEAGSRQSHTGIVAIHAVGEHEGVHFIAQELVTGGVTLNDKLEELRKTGEQPSGYFREVAKLIAQIADSLNHAHESGVIHRDIKPSNILLTEEGYPKITDFGLAKIEDALALSRTGDFAGTPYYMSPEQAMSRRIGIDKRTDIYSLGVTLYEMLTLKRPFEGETSHEVLKKIIFLSPLDPHKANPRVPRDLSVICLKAMEKVPEKRYQSMKAFCDDLNRFLSGDVILAKPAGLITRSYKRIKTHPTISTAAVILLLAIVSIAVLTITSLIRDRIHLQEILRYSDMDRIYRLRSEADELWPTYPDKVPEMKAWLNDADEVVGRYNQHRHSIEELKKKEQLSEEEQRQLERLKKLTFEIESLVDEEAGLINDVKNRLDIASTISQKSIGDHKEDWEKSILSISDSKVCPQYDGLEIKPQLGFVPIGQDPDSGLWEFAHLLTGEIPIRDSDGKLLLNEDMGLVFVLMPGGIFNMGAVPPANDNPIGSPNLDPAAKPEEGPVHEVMIQPFFLSKYEMTQGQWLHFTKANPSMHGPGVEFGDKKVTLLHPVEQVTWDDCTDVLLKLRLRLPSESEWEYACRAGTGTVFWTGDDKKTLQGAVNLSDLFLKKNGGHSNWVYEEWLDDGYAIHAPVGTYSANTFGLYDVHGNVWEWCEDAWHSDYSNAPADGSAWVESGSSGRVRRGGGWWGSSQRCRSSIRGRDAEAFLDVDLGLRPARSLDMRTDE